MDPHLPLILIEGVLTFGGVLAFACWQFRDLRREREKTARAAEQAAQDKLEAMDAGSGDEERGGVS
jgi:Tfp pilus assembly protein PilV